MELFDTLFVLVLLGLGGGISVMADNIYRKVTPDKCPNTIYHNANRGLFGLSLILIVLAMSFIICNLNCNCGKAFTMEKWFYFFSFLIIGIVCVVLGSILVHQSDTVGCDNNKRDCWNIVQMGLGLIVLTLIYFAYMIYGKYYSKKLPVKPSAAVPSSQLFALLNPMGAAPGAKFRFRR